MIRVLHIVDHMGQGGIQALIMNVYNFIDKEHIQFDFLLHHKLDSYYENQIDLLGGKMYYVPPRGEGIINNITTLNDFYDKHNEYRIVHMHESSLSYITPLTIAKKHKLEKRIIHAHSSSMTSRGINELLHRINKKRIGGIANYYLSCGELANKWFYDNTPTINKSRIIKNGIDVNQFSYCEKTRNEVRREFGLKDKFVVGHVGRFSPVKNHSFIVDIFNKLTCVRPDSILLLVGDGDQMNSIRQKVCQMGLSQKVIFAGTRKDIFRIYQAMDCFILPSLYEGFPVSAIEAQAAGLPCFISNSITKEVFLKKNVYEINIFDSPEIIAEKIAVEKEREIDNSILIDNGLDISHTVSELMGIYCH